jgi:hypothetical protein
MKNSEKILIILGIVNFFLFLNGLMIGIPAEIPKLLLAAHVTPFSPNQVLIQLLFFFFIFIIPGLIFSLIFFKESTWIEKILIGFIVSGLIFGIYDFLGAGMLTPPKFYSIVGVHTLVFIIFFSALGGITAIFKFLERKKVISSKLFNIIFILLTIFFGFFSLNILKLIPFDRLTAIQKVIPWWFNPNCICAEMSFLITLASAIIAGLLFSFILELKKKFALIPILLFLAFILITVSKIVDTYHGILSFGSPTGLTWREDLAFTSSILTFLALIFFLTLNLELFKVVKRI